MRNMDLRKIDLNLLVVLNVLLEELHISNSASRLNLSQPAMSRALARLREMFDDPLIVRVSKGYRRTPRGESLVNPVQFILDNIQSTLTEREFDPEVYQREFAICTLDYGEAVLVPKIMERLMADAPGIKLKITHRRIYSIAEVLDGSADILLGTIPESPPKHCVVQPLYDDRFVCVVHKQHPLANRTMTLNDYVSYPHSIIHTGESPGTSIDVALEQLNLRRNIVKSSPHFVASILSVGRTDVIQTIPHRLADMVVQYSDLVVKELPIEVGPVKIGQMWHMRNLKDQAHIWFREVVKAAAVV
ncbi:MAG: LysR family transcriptional regulator [Pseudomonadota bacterium]